MVLDPCGRDGDCNSGYFCSFTKRCLPKPFVLAAGSNEESIFEAFANEIHKKFGCSNDNDCLVGYSDNQVLFKLSCNKVTKMCMPFKSSHNKFLEE